MQKDILVHGRLYVTQNWICFYANIFRWETVVSTLCVCVCVCVCVCWYVQVTVVWECRCEGRQGERYVWGWRGGVKCVGGICLSHHFVYYSLVSRFAGFLGNVVFPNGHATFYGKYEVFGGEIGGMGRG